VAHLPRQHKAGDAIAGFMTGGYINLKTALA
jgi:hypothetical protein